MTGFLMDSMPVFIHVLAALLLVGESVASRFTRARIRASSDVGSLRLWLDQARRMASANPVIALSLLASGVYLGSRGWWLMAWFYVALGTFVANSLLAVLFVKTSAQRVGRSLAGIPDGPVPDAVDVLRRRALWDVAADIMLANDLATLYMMVSKPTLLYALAMVAIANVLVVTMGAVRRSTSSEPGAADLERARAA